MALYYTRLLCKKNMGFNALRAFHTSKNLPVATTNTVLTKAVSCETHDEKNMRLKRPLSPHLSIYQIQLTTVLSISHRATGMILSGYAAALGISTLLLPGGLPCLLQATSALCLPTAIVFATKFALAFPVTFHFCNGIRHLSWDLGMFLKIKEVYSTGYAMVAAATVLAVALACI